MSTNPERSKPHPRGLISRANTILLTIGAALGLSLLILGLTWSARTSTLGIIILLAVGAQLICAIMAHRGFGSEVFRINALEYADERDRDIARRGLSIVGIVAIIATLVLLLLTVLVDLSGNTLTGILTALVIGLNLTWALANSVYAQRF